MAQDHFQTTPDPKKGNGRTNTQQRVKKLGQLAKYQAMPHINHKYQKQKKTVRLLMAPPNAVVPAKKW